MAIIATISAVNSALPSGVPASAQRVDLVLTVINTGALSVNITGVTL